MNEIERVAVIGAGLAGLSCARHLQQQGLEVRLFEKSRGAAGRMSTRRGEGWQCDHGAQYFTARDPDFRAEVARWQALGVAAVWQPRLEVFGAADLHTPDETLERFVGTPRMTAPARSLALTLDLRLQSTVQRVERAPLHQLGQRAFERIGQERFDLVLLDVMLPGLDGFEVCRKVREFSSVPIIMLTAKSDESDELMGFDLGVDEYITKPFSPKILVARVEAILRRTNKIGDAADFKTAGEIILDKTAHEVKISGNPVELSFKEFELLEYFMNNQGIALSRERILNSVWNYDYFGDARTIDTHVKKLRNKLGACGSYIKTVWGMGYKFEVS